MQGPPIKTISCLLSPQGSCHYVCEIAHPCLSNLVSICVLPFLTATPLKVALGTRIALANMAKKRGKTSNQRITKNQSQANLKIQLVRLQNRPPPVLWQDRQRPTGMRPFVDLSLLLPEIFRGCLIPSLVSNASSSKTCSSCCCSLGGQLEMVLNQPS